MAIKRAWATSTARVRRRRALVVDDAESIRAYLADLLELKGFEVDTAEDGRKGVALLESGAAPDVVLLDVLMPGAGGLETLKQMRAFDEDVHARMSTTIVCRSFLLRIGKGWSGSNFSTCESPTRACRTSYVVVSLPGMSPTRKSLATWTSTLWTVARTRLVPS